MGREQRQREKVEKLGKFNVIITVVYNDSENSRTEFEAKSWAQQGHFLAIEHYDGSLRVINLNNTYEILITNNPTFSESNEESTIIQ